MVLLLRFNYSWDPIARTWSYVAPMSSMRSTAAVAVMGNRLYVVGGRDGSLCHRSVECYDPHTNKWTLRAPMNKRRGGVGVSFFVFDVIYNFKFRDYFFIFYVGCRCQWIFVCIRWS